MSQTAVSSNFVACSAAMQELELVTPCVWSRATPSVLQYAVFLLGFRASLETRLLSLACGKGYTMAASRKTSTTEAMVGRERLEVQTTPSVGEGLVRLIACPRYKETASVVLVAVRQLLADGRQGKKASSPHTSKMPESAVLAQLRSFLPQMQTANQQLAQQAPAAPAVSIKSLQEDEQHVPDQESDDDTDQHVQMDIACGVLELKDQAAVRAAEAMLSGAACTAGTESSTDSESESDHSMEDSFDMDSDASPTAAAPQQDQQEPHILTNGLSKVRRKDDTAARERANRTTSSQARHEPSKILEL